MRLILFLLLFSLLSVSASDEIRVKTRYCIELDPMKELKLKLLQKLNSCVNKKVNDHDKIECVDRFFRKMEKDSKIKKGRPKCSLYKVT